MDENGLTAYWLSVDRPEWLRRGDSADVRRPFGPASRVETVATVIGGNDGRVTGDRHGWLSRGYPLTPPCISPPR